jgi:ribosomal-protein-alanine N-acetyltransferase
MTDTQSDFPTLETSRLILRPLVDDDIEFVFRHFSDPDVTKYLLDNPPLAERSEAQELIDFYKAPTGTKPTRWCVVSKRDDRAIGTCGYHNWSARNRRAEIGYDLSPDAWGQGFMSEALGAAIDYGFNHMNLNRIEALVYPENVRSVRLLERLGFQVDGVLRDYFFHDGKFYDHQLFSLLRREWKGAD